MANKEIVETIYGKTSKYEIVKESGGLMGSTKFIIRRNGKYFKGTYSDLSKAVQVARDQG